MTTITDNGQNLENITVPGFSQGNNDSFDKTLIQWKLSLSQIGLYLLTFIIFGGVPKYCSSPEFMHIHMNTLFS